MAVPGLPFVGEVEYDTIAEVKSCVGIPVIANGDIDSPEKARDVLRRTGADALMIAGQRRDGVDLSRDPALPDHGSHLPAPGSRRSATCWYSTCMIFTRSTGNKGRACCAQAYRLVCQGACRASEFRQTMNRLEPRISN